jgi:signal peptidase II
MRKWDGNHLSMRKALLAFGILRLVLVSDQFSKRLLVTAEAPEFGGLALLPVPGLVYGRAQTGLLRGLWDSLGLLVVALRLIGGLTGWLRRTESRSTVVALGAVAGGVVSDVVDVVRARSVAGYVHTGIIR